jgi:uncharacterized protein (TIGR02996 family)
MDHVDFLQEIAALPEDDIPRLIYADWLEERGDPRAEFIRVQCELAAMDRDDERREELEYRERDLLFEHEDEWVGRIAKIATSWVFYRGFVHYVVMPVSRFLQHAETMFELAPIAAVKFKGFHSNVRMRSLAECPWLKRLSAMGLGNCSLTDQDLEALCESRFLGKVTHLLLPQNRFGNDGVRALAGCAGWQTLTLLDLSGNRLRNADVKLLAECPHMSKLQTLLISGNEIRLQGARALASSPYLDRLTYLELTGNPIDGRGIDALRQRFGRTACKI